MKITSAILASLLAATAWPADEKDNAGKLKIGDVPPDYLGTIN